MLDSVFKECRKDNPTYKMAALKCFGEIVQEYSIDRFQQISELLFPIIAPVSTFKCFSTSNFSSNFSIQYLEITKETGDENKDGQLKDIVLI